MCARMYITVFCGTAYLYFCTYICLNKFCNKTKSVSGAITYYTPSLSFSMGLWDTNMYFRATCCGLIKKHIGSCAQNS